MNEQITIHLDNLTEEEREQFTKLLSKASEESSKGSRVWKPENNEEYYFINDLKLGMCIKRERKCALH